MRVCAWKRASPDVLRGTLCTKTPVMLAYEPAAEKKKLFQSTVNEGIL